MTPSHAVMPVSIYRDRDVQSPMLSQSEQATVNLEEARNMRAAGRSYREIRHQLRLSPGQLGHIRRTLKREKASRTRLRSIKPLATDRELPISQSILPSGLRQRLASFGYTTLGDLADRLADPDFPGLETLPGIGVHKAGLVKRVLDHFGLLQGSADLQAAVEHLFPEFSDPHSGGEENLSSTDIATPANRRRGA